MKQNRKTKRTQKPSSERETLEERVHRHLSDINSKITDDDIRNVKTELEIRAEGGTEAAQEKAAEEAMNNEDEKTAMQNGLSEGDD